MLRLSPIIQTIEGDKNLAQALNLAQSKEFYANIEVN